MAKSYKTLPTPTDLWEHFDLELWTGRLIRKPIAGSTTKLGYFGRISSKGYVYGVFKGKSYYAHRLVWCWRYGSSPGSLEVDHVDRNRSNNTPFNLRLVPARLQARNTSVYKNNTSGFKGVRKLPRTQSSYQARIRVDGVLIHLGCFNDKELAYIAYKQAANRYFGELAD